MSNGIYPFPKTIHQQLTDQKNDQINRQEQLIDQKEKDIQRVGAEYDAKKKVAKSQERAAINHIRDNVRSNIEIENKKAHLAMAKLKTQQNQSYEHMRNKGQARIEALQEELQQKIEYYKKEIQKVDEYYEKEAKDVRSKHFNELKSRHKFHNQVYEHMEDRTEDAIQKRQKEMMDQFITNPGTPQDTFYHMTGFPAQLVEEPDHYTLFVQVPEHEVKNVNVIVKPEQITISAQRNLNKVHENSYRKVETNNYQSTRDVIALKHPVRKGLTSETYDHESQMIVVQVPKA